MSDTMIKSDLEILQEAGLDFEPCCEDPRCDQPATHEYRVWPSCGCKRVHLLCTPHAERTATYLQQVREWYCGAQAMHPLGVAKGTDFASITPLPPGQP